MSRGDRFWIQCMEIGHKMGCHQMESRSFSIKGYQFPVCARCTGVILGESVAIILIILGIRIDVIFSAFLLGIMGIDWGLQRVGLLESTNMRRLFTGICGGFGMIYAYLYSFMFIIDLVRNM